METNVIIKEFFFYDSNLLLYLVDVTAYAQQRQQNRLPLEEMGNLLLDAMQGTLICLDSHNIIIDVSKTIKRYFGFEQVCSELEIPLKKFISIFSLKLLAFQYYYLLKTVNEIYSRNFFQVHHNVSKPMSETHTVIYKIYLDYLLNN